MYIFTWPFFVGVCMDVHVCVVCVCVAEYFGDDSRARQTRHCRRVRTTHPPDASAERETRHDGRTERQQSTMHNIKTKTRTHSPRVIHIFSTTHTFTQDQNVRHAPSRSLLRAIRQVRWLPASVASNRAQQSSDCIYISIYSLIYPIYILGRYVRRRSPYVPVWPLYVLGPP